MRRRTLIPLFFIILLVSATAVYGYTATDTGYYLPKGYKVDAKIYVPDPPFWGGENLGDIVGVSTNDYSVLIVGYGWHDFLLSKYKRGVKVVWSEGGKQEVKATVEWDDDPWANNGAEHSITITYGNDGQVKISVDGQFVYSFVATASKYSIISQGASISQPQPLPSDSNNNDAGTGEGYNPPSVGEIQTQYLLFGAGAVALVALVLGLMRRRR